MTDPSPTGERPRLADTASTLWRIAAPLLAFGLLWWLTLHVDQRAQEDVHARDWSRFQRAAAQQIAWLRSELDKAPPGALDTPGETIAGALRRYRFSGLRDVAFEVIDVTASPTQVFRDAEVEAAEMSYVETIEAGGRRWLVEAAPASSLYAPGADSPSRTLLWAGFALSVLGAALVSLLQNRARAVRHQVQRQTIALEQANQRLAEANLNLRCEIDNRMRSEDALRSHAALQQAILESADYGIVSTDSEGLIQLFNPAAERIFGWRAEELVGRATPVLFYPEEELTRREMVYRVSGFASLVAEASDGQAIEPHELTLLRKDGTTFPASLAISPLHDPQDEGTRGYLGIVADISHRKADERRIRFLAHYDALTELPNRSLLNIRLAEALDRSRRHKHQVAVLFLDLDRFKYVNDSLGHQAGDALLQAVSRRFTTCVRDCDTVARMGGDEFVLVVADVDTRERAAEVATRVLASLGSPFEVRGHTLTVTPSIGIALYPDDGDDVETLIKHADAAMYLAKEEGRNNYQFFTRSLSSHVSERLVVESHLRRALERGEFELHYQAQVDATSGEIVGMEALLRWHSPELGTVSPVRFIPIAEDSGLIIPIGAWVLRTACEQNRAWQDEGLLEVPVAVNLSARQFDQADLLESISRVLAETGLAPDRLEIELTESLVMRDPERTSATLAGCKQLGLQIAIDDFGTGYSSLAYLRRFPIDRLKIDRSFIRDIVDEPDDAAIAQTIIAMAHSLRLTALAEGVETEAQLRMLRSWNCDSYQGYLSSRPMSGEQTTAMLRGLKAAHLVGLPTVPGQ